MPLDRAEGPQLELLRRAFQAAPIGIAVVSSKKTWLEVNRAWCRLIGYSAASLLGRKVDERLLGEQRDELHALMDAEAEDKEAELSFRRADGSTLLACVRSSRILEEDGSPVYILQFEDISARKAAEAALTESEARYRLLAENTSDMVGLHAPDGQPLYVSPSSERVLGLAPGALVGQAPYSHTHPDDVAPVRRAHRQVVEDKQPASVACRLRRPDGSYLWCEMNVMPVLDDQGELTYIQTVTRDISGRMERQHALWESEQKFRAIFNAQPSAVLYTDAQGTILECNPAVDELFHYDMRELLGRHVWTLFAPGTRYAELLELLERQAEQVLWEYPLEGQRKDGSRFPAELIATALRDPAGIRAYLWMLRDVSAKEQAQRDLAEARRRLVGSREEERLRVARELHDGPVQDLIGLCYRLDDWKVDGGEAGLEAQVAALRASLVNIVKQLRGTVGELRGVALEGFGFSAGLEGYLAKASQQGGEGFPEVVLEIDPAVDDLPEAVKTCLFRVAQEGLSNALRHAAPKRVTLRLKRLEDEAQLLIEDDGEGFEVPADLREFLKRERFGLAGVAERVKLMGGTVSLRSRQSLGSELAVSLPVFAERKR